MATITDSAVTGKTPNNYEVKILIKFLFDKNNSKII